jgi:hypothetical protein
VRSVGWIVAAMALVLGVVSCGDDEPQPAESTTTSTAPAETSTSTTTATAPTTSSASTATTRPRYGSACAAGSHPDCIDLDGDGVAGYPDSG